MDKNIAAAGQEQYNKINIADFYPIDASTES